MSMELFPFAVWLAGTNQNSIPANDNALRNEVLAKAALSVLDAEPSESIDGDLHIVGAAWGGFASDDVVIYRSGTWYGFAPFDGWLKRLNETGELLCFEDSSGWVAQISGGDNGLVGVNTQSGTTYTLASADSGLVVRTTNSAEVTITVPVNTSDAIPIGATIAIRQAGSGQIVLVADSDVIINVPDGSDAASARGGSTIMLHKIASDEWDLTGDLLVVASS